MSSASSSRVTIGPVRGVRGIGMVAIVAGIVMVLAGLGVWILVSMTLADENITVSDDARMFAGQQVAGPFTAYAQAEVIDQHATEMADGQTYAELPQDDPRRDAVMNASFLRASLFTSVVAFGVCALVVGLGILFVLMGGALRRLAGGPQVAIETPGLSSHGDLSASGRHADEPTSPLPPTPPGPPPTRSSSRPAPDAPTTPGSSDRPSDRPPAAPPVAGPESGPGTPRPSDPGDGPRA